MPPIGQPNEFLIWPEWSLPQKRYLVNAWPKTNSPRIKGEFRTPFYSDMQPIPTRVLIKYGWSETITIQSNEQWFWADAELLPGPKYVWDFGVGPGLQSVRVECEYRNPLPIWQPAAAGFSFKFFMTSGPDPEVVRISDVAGWPLFDYGVDRGFFNQKPWDSASEPGTGEPFDVAFFPFQGVQWQPMADEWPLDQLTTE